MKKKYNPLLVILVTFFVFSFLASTYKVPPTVKATYVQGTITQDTAWTLVDSPFILSNDIIVNPGATLTIEPGVQVRFGGDFSITVNGAIIADGTSDRMILFTSNNPNASIGDWGTILISSSQQSSITNCIIEYGTNGTTLESGSLNFQNNIVASNLNGIVVDDGSATITNNEITNNTVNGVGVNGGNQVIVENNFIDSNGYGVALTGNLAGYIGITQNNVSLNSQSGILLDADAYYDTAILQNNVSSNNYGFDVASDTSPYITCNYIFDNNNGIFYETGTGHQVHFNDIYNNTVGMDVSSTIDNYAVNATYNYWGDESGPFHASLNPDGKGNPVGGNGTNLLFIFFLSAPFDYNNTPPVAVLQTDKTLVAPNEDVTFIGTNSFDDWRVDQYFFDFGDGTNSGWTTLTLVDHAYSTVGTYNASLTVMDDFGATSQNVATATINVQDLTPLTVSITPSSEEAYCNGNATVDVYVSNGLGQVENAAVTLLSLRGGSFLQSQGVTNATGYFETTWTAPYVTDTTYVRLIATASQAGYADGSSYADVEVLPPLQISMTTNPSTVKSEATVAVTFQVSNGLGQPVANASLTAAADSGDLSPSTGFTDINGNVTFNFAAPYTLSPLNVTFTASALKPGYTDGYYQEAITVFPNILTVKVTPDSTSIVSEGSTNVAVLVTCDAEPVQDSNVTVSSGNVGNFDLTTENTDSNGVATFNFTAPQTTVPVNATITATATKSLYVDGADQTVINIAPKVLLLYLTAQNYTTNSEANVGITATVTYNLAPVQGANVTVSSQNQGNFSQFTATTDAQGLANFVFTAPQVNAPTNIAIVALGSMTGYVNAQDSLTLTVNPANISVQITANSYAILPDKSAILTVNAASNSRPVVDAQVIVSADAGNFSAKTGFTDSNGDCSFVFNAPSTTVQIAVHIVANVTKNGYVGNESQTTINVIPMPVTRNEGGGWPMLTMLLIIIPVVIALILVVLIKLNVIVVSTGEEGGPE